MPPQSSGVFSERRELMGMCGMGKKEIVNTRIYCTVCRHKGRTCVAGASIYEQFLCETTHTQEFKDLKSVFTVNVFSRWLTNAELPHQQELVNALARQAREVIRDPVNAWTSIQRNREATEAQAARIQALEATMAERDQMLKLHRR